MKINVLKDKFEFVLNPDESRAAELRTLMNVSELLIQASGRPLAFGTKYTQEVLLKAINYYIEGIAIGIDPSIDGVLNDPPQK